jgi:hypothetical protein
VARVYLIGGAGCGSLRRAPETPNAELAGSIQLWEWIGDEGATTLGY